MNRRLIIAASTLGLLCAGCTKDNAEANNHAPDAGETPKNVRKLVLGHLLGDTPIDNRVHNPHFEFTSQFWYGYAGMNMCEMRRVSLPKTPSALPALQVLPGNSDRTIVGTFRGGPRLRAEVWIGRDWNEDGEYNDIPVVSMYGLTATSGWDAAFDLQAEEGSEQDIDSGNGTKIHWQRYSGVAEEELLGLCSLVLQDSGAANIYLNGPVVALVTDSGTQVWAGSPRRAVPAAVKRAPTARESQAVERAMKALRDRPPSRLPDPADGIAPRAR